MKITIYELISVLAIEEKISSLKLPIKAAYRLSKILARAHEEQKFFQEKFQEIIQKYGEKDAEGKLISTKDGNISLQKDKIEDCSKELDELYNLEVELPNYSFSIEDFGELEMSIDDLSPLMSFICEI